MSKESNKLWLQDFELLKQEMTSGYANLKYAKEKEGLDLIQLSDTTRINLKKAESQKKAQEIIRKFLSVFKDGHLNATLIKEESINGSEAEQLPNSNEMDSLALTKMNYQNVDIQKTIKFDSIDGFHSLSTDTNPFESSIIKNGGHSIGVIRIEIFLTRWYLQTANMEWKSFKKTFDGDCDEDCQWTFYQKVEDKLLEHLTDRIDELKNMGMEALIINVSNNGGGTEWCNAVANLLTSKHLKHLDASFVRHKHWTGILEDYLSLVQNDLKNTQLKPDLISKLEKLESLLSELIEKTKEYCDPSHVWSNQNLNCLELIQNPFFGELPFGIGQHEQLEELESKSLLEIERFLPFKKGVYDGPLYIVQDKYSGSATEEFSSLLQANDAAIIVGEVSYGAGCGYNHGGFKLNLPHIGLTIRMPDCARFRKDGMNEIHGIEPDIKINWNKKNSHEKGAMVIDRIRERLE
ncbi:S41 family peptidase [Muricauda sp. 2012CJ35-5]|uniref:S41 family peptidase n=1 Tax=Flagellimonas spongiicola TaxID=2942208 RepID=A0ABT0PMC6_9FLAO|nr:S41 family peptidase [Allomuricauda spongiicola]MCL6272514.1 S41 family peptidase [Allomuricauda spongiicola]